MSRAFNACLPLFLAIASSAVAQTPAAPIKLDLTPRETHVDFDPSRFEGSAIEPAIQPRTAVERRFGADGPTASAGYLCGLSGIGPDGDGTRGGPASAYGAFGRFLGATVAYPIR